MKPIPFTTEEVKAILAGRKSQTRRVIKPQPEGEVLNTFPCSYAFRPGFGRYGFVINGREPSNIQYIDVKYEIGDILWVQETWANDPDGVIFKADYVDWQLEKFASMDYKWKPSIHMPREAARLFLKVTSVRVERLKDISEADAKAEGITDGGCTNCGNSSFPNPCGCDKPSPDYVDSFYWLWDSINEKRKGCALIYNPWVWVYEFERVMG